MRSWVCAGYAPPTDARQGSRTQNLGPTKKQRWCPPPFNSKICAGGMRSALANKKTLFSWVCAGVCAPRRPMDYRLSYALGGMRSAPANKNTLFLPSRQLTTGSLYVRSLWGFWRAPSYFAGGVRGGGSPPGQNNNRKNSYSYFSLLIL